MKICTCCGKPKKPAELDGLGTSLKPAIELIALARKPLSEKTIAANVLRWGTGALNIDGCRIGTDTRTRLAEVPNMRKSNGPSQTNDGRNSENWDKYKDHTGSSERTYTGRWPANLCHDNSPEVLAGFPDLGRAGVAGTAGKHGSQTEYVGGGHKQGTQLEPSGFGDSGSAARFFASFPQDETAKRFHYTSKADGDDRLGSRHPTVKPVDLMQWLVRLVCPKGATVLDLFAGTGTTGAAAFIEGRRCVLIEREAEYLADIEKRMGMLLSGSEERSWKLAKPEQLEALPLFATVGD